VTLNASNSVINTRSYINCTSVGVGSGANNASNNASNCDAHNSSHRAHHNASHNFSDPFEGLKELFERIGWRLDDIESRISDLENSSCSSNSSVADQINSLN
jgi:hypothetical protein